MEDGLAGRVAEVRPASAEPADRTGAVKELASQIKRAQARLEQTPAREEPATRTAEFAEAVNEVLPPSSASDNWTDLTQDASPPKQPDLLAETQAGHHKGNGNGIAHADRQDAALAQDLPQATSILPERRRPRLLDRLSGMAKG